MLNIISFLYYVIQSYYTLFVVLCLALFVKTYYLTKLVPHIFPLYLSILKKPLFFLVISIASASIIDLAWLIKLFHTLVTPNTPYFPVVFFIRTSWAFFIIQHQSLALFLQALSTKHFRLNLFNKITLAASTFFVGYFFYIAFFHWNYLATVAERNIGRATESSWEFFIMEEGFIYFFIYLIMGGLILCFYNMRRTKYPKILHSQLRLFILYLIMPYLAMELLTTYCPYEILIISISTLLLSYAIHYCLKNVIKLRFMSVTPHVQAPPQAHIIEDFKIVIDQLGKTSSMQELIHITQTFFKYAFGVFNDSVDLVIRELHTKQNTINHLGEKHHIIEQFLSNYMEQIKEESYIENQIFVYDEIAFNDFYDEDNTHTTTLQFLEKIKASVFLPIYSKKKIIAYLTVRRNARAKFFSQAERDTIIVFGRHLGNIIHLLQHKNLALLMQKEKELKDNLYAQHQEINQYKESINVFLRRSKQKTIGIIFYKNGTFTLGNEDARRIIPINLNLKDGHPITKACKMVAQYVQSYQAPYTQYVSDTHHNPLIISGIANPEKRNVILTITHPDISDVISGQKHLLHNPNDWDYLLYLSTTNAGTAINQLFPGMGEILLNFKINILKTALSRKAILLDLPNDDALPTAQLLNTLGSRDTFHHLKLTEVSTRETIATQLFGNTASTDSLPLLRTLHNGTLFIQNIHLLDLATQQNLAEFITCGTYQIFGTDQHESSSARIICATNQNLAQRVHEGKFARELFAVFKPSTLCLPSLMTMQKHELYHSITTFADSFITSHTAKNFLSLTEKEKTKLIEQQPSSMHELKKNIELIILKKSNESHVWDPQQPNSEYDDPIIAEASDLGRRALKDPHMLKLLWEKLKTQNKIALLLGVNRSSVNRRLVALGIGKKETAEVAL